MAPHQTRQLAARQRRQAGRSRQSAAPQPTTEALDALIQRAEQAPQTLSPGDVMVLQRALGNQATADVLQRLSSASIEAAVKGNNVAKAPLDMGANRFKSRMIIHKLEIANFPEQAGTITNCEGGKGEIRVDKQGEYDANNRRWINIQAQANKDDRGKYDDLTYPPRTRSEQKGTTLGEVHVEERLTTSGQQDVTSRTERLIKQALFDSIGPRSSANRAAYKVYSTED